MRKQLATARKRLSVLQLAEQLGSVAEACRRHGVERSNFYRWRHRYETGGLAALADRTPVHPPRPNATNSEVMTRVVALSLAHPASGCDRLEALLDAEHVTLSAVTIQRILNESGLGNRRARCAELERRHAGQEIELSAAQIAFVEAHNSNFRDRNDGTAGPGDVLYADTMVIGARKGRPRLYIHTLIDSWTCVAFGLVSLTKEPEAAIELLSGEAMPFFMIAGFLVKTIVMGHGGEFSGPGRHPYLEVLKRLKLTGRRLPAAQKHSGHSEVLHQALLRELLTPNPGDSTPTDFPATQHKVRSWLQAYNALKRCDGFPLFGKAPLDALQQPVQPQP